MLVFAEIARDFVEGEYVPIEPREAASVELLAMTTRRWRNAFLPT
jgi:hypothetical protein